MGPAHARRRRCATSGSRGFAGRRGGEEPLASPTTTSSKVVKAADAQFDDKLESWSAPSSSRPSCAWCCCSPSTRTGASTSRRSTTCARASTCAATRRRTPSRSTSARPFELFSQLLDLVKMEVTRVMMTVRIQSQVGGPSGPPRRSRSAPSASATSPTRTPNGTARSGRADPATMVAAGAQGGPQRPLPGKRAAAKIQAVPRQAGLS